MTDEWNVDVAVTDSQKALAARRDSAHSTATEATIDASDGDDAPFYADLDWHVRKAGSHQTPFTSAVPLFRAMAEAVEQLVEEGMSHRIRRHRRQNRAVGDGFTAMGRERVPTVERPTELSNTLTAIELPESVTDDPEAFFDAVAERNASISGGQADFGGHIFRVSNTGD